MDKSKFGKFLLKLRRERDLTQTELAGIIGVSHQAVSKWEKGDSLPDIELLKKLCELYGYSLDDLINCKENSVEIQRIKTEENRILRLKLLIGIQLTIIGYLSAYFSAFAVSEVLSTVCFGIFLVSATVGFMFNLMHYKIVKDKEIKTYKFYALSIIFSLGNIYYIVELLFGRPHYNINDILLNGPQYVILAVPVYYMILGLIYKINNIKISISRKQIIEGTIVSFILVIMFLVYRWYYEDLYTTIGADYWFDITRYGYASSGFLPWEMKNFLLFFQIDLSIIIIVLISYKRFKDLRFLTLSFIVMIVLLLYNIVDKSLIDNFWLGELLLSRAVHFFFVFALLVANAIIVVWMFIRITNHNDLSKYSILAITSNLIISIGFSMLKPDFIYLDSVLRDRWNLDYYYRVHPHIFPITYTVLISVIFLNLIFVLVDRLQKMKTY